MGCFGGDKNKDDIKKKSKQNTATAKKQEFSAKVVICGESMVGKTSIIETFMNRGVNARDAQQTDVCK